ncbi:MAG TPA: adenylate/guanylate cyclase domain-containing protein [Mycobacteriales bacterium]|nr:adenylate/guanylate cyclase domain-containing protein [Mycobacteriales bacterium]
MVSGDADATSGAKARGVAPDPLTPYVPTLVVDWLADAPQQRHRRIAGTGLFADISGFTALTERLAERGKAGAEEMGDLLNSTFDALLSAAYDYGASLLKWGGDAVLLLFDGNGHAIRAAQAAWEMQSALCRVGRLKTSVGMVDLGMSIGIHSGEFDFMLVGSRYRELIVTGPAATATAHLEKVAERGQVVISSATRAAIPAGCAEVGATDGCLLTASPGAVAAPNKTRPIPAVDLAAAFCADLRDHLRGDVVDYEHRRAVVGFIEFSGTDALLAADGVDSLTDAVDHVVSLAQEAAADSGVTVLSTDLCEDGGKIILVAGAPNSVGDGESRVLSAVRRVVHPGGRLSLRAGVNVGRVFAGDYGPSYRRVYSVTGDCVNLAARLMAHAEPGQVVAMPEVLDGSRTQFETTPLPPFTVKGKAAEIEALSVGDPRRAAVAVGNRLPLAGRDEELGVLLDGVAAATCGEGRVIELVGGPGMGKSRLLEELAERTDVRILWADGEVYATTTPYQPMRRLLRHTLGLADDVDEQALAARLRDLTAGTAPDLLPMLPLIGVVAGVDYPETPEVAALDQEVRKSYLESAVSDLLGRLLRMPLVMVLNDLYLMDEATIDLLKRLSSDVANRPWLIIATRRHETSSPFPVGQPLTVIKVEPLSETAAVELIASSPAASELPPHRVRELVERAGGNPLFLRELISSARAGADLAELPDSVEGVIAAHIDRLPPKRRRWLRAAAVLGMTVDHGLLGSVLGPEADDVDVATEMSEFLVGGADGQWRFSHHLVRAAAYEGLPYRRRTELHARTADLLERRAAGNADAYADLLSMHCFHGERFERAWHYSRLAAERARGHYALAEAAECYRRALSSATRLTGGVAPAVVAKVCEDLSVVYLDLGERSKADQALADGRRHAKGDPLLSASLWLRTATHREQSGRYSEALRWVTKARLLLGARDDQESVELQAQLAELAASARFRQGRFVDAIADSHAALVLARRCGDRRTEAHALTVREAAGATIGLPFDVSKLTECIAIYEDLGDVRGLARAYNWFGGCAYYAGHWDDAVDLFQRAERAYWKAGREYDAATNAANRAEVLIAQGRLDDIDEILTNAMTVWRSTDSTSAVGFGLFLRGQAQLARGQVDDALKYLAEARAIRVELRETDDVVTTDAVVAECHLRLGDLSTALRCADSALSRAGVGAPGTPLLLRVRGEALIGLGRGVEGIAALRAGLAEARGRNARHDVAATLAALIAHDVPSKSGELDAWRQEYAELARMLGLVANVSG